MQYTRKPKPLTRPQNTCAQCVFAEVDRKPINRSLDGRYFMLHCEFSEWKHFFHDAACEHFVNREIPINQ